MKGLLGSKLKRDIQRFMEGDTHAALLIGPEVNQLSESIEAQLKITNNILITKLSPEKSSITIDQVRELKRSLSLRQHEYSNRVLLIESSESMTNEAQNSLLKILEEPPRGLRFFILASSKQHIIQTILSRVLVLHIGKISLEEALDYYESLLPSIDQIKKMHSIADGAPGKLFSLLNDESAEYTDAINEAKKILAESVFDRLTRIDTLSKNKPMAIDVCNALEDILRAVSHAPSTSNSSVKMLTQKRKIVAGAQKSLLMNVNTKLVLVDVFLAL